MTTPARDDDATGVALARMTWPEVDRARQVAPLAIVPTGACEQHGHHMVLETDAVRGAEVARRLAERLAPRAVVTPCLSIGVSGHHMRFPGTLSLSPLTFQQVLYEVVESLHAHGWRHVFVLNGHGGNNSATGVAVSRLQAAYPDLNIAWSGVTPVVADLGRDLASSEGAAHGSEIETSQALYVDPGLVREEQLDVAEPPQRYSRLRAPAGVHAPTPFHRISADGTTGLPSAASREIGEKLVTAVVERLADFLSDFLDQSGHESQHESQHESKENR
ncbi:MAG TPA: creatininase family protein [Marmoricola sp.]|jgi:creatinine amidohydrolase|nr:creatininase family protein [Marmoricola sp.]